MSSQNRLNHINHGRYTVNEIHSIFIPFPGRMSRHQPRKKQHSGLSFGMSRCPTLILSDQCQADVVFYLFDNLPRRRLLLCYTTSVL